MVLPEYASDVRSYDGYGGGLSGLSAHNAAELSGNVREWEFTASYGIPGGGSYNNIYSTDSDSYAGYGSWGDRVIRGGDWSNVALWMRAGSRLSDPAAARGNYNGFRAARLP